MHIRIVISEEEIRRILVDHLKSRLGEIPFEKDRLIIEVKSKQNYKSEWEAAAFRAAYDSVGH